MHAPRMALNRRLNIGQRCNSDDQRSGYGETLMISFGRRVGSDR